MCKSDRNYAHRDVGIEIELRNRLSWGREVALRRKSCGLLPQEERITMRSISLIGIWGYRILLERVPIAVALKLTSIGSDRRLGHAKDTVGANCHAINEPMARWSRRRNLSNWSWVDQGEGLKGN